MFWTRCALIIATCTTVVAVEPDMTWTVGLDPAIASTPFAQKPVPAWILNLPVPRAGLPPVASDQQVGRRPQCGRGNPHLG